MMREKPLMDGKRRMWPTLRYNISAWTLCSNFILAVQFYHFMMLVINEYRLVMEEMVVELCWIMPLGVSVLLLLPSRSYQNLMMTWSSSHSRRLLEDTYSWDWTNCHKSKFFFSYFLSTLNIWFTLIIMKSSTLVAMSKFHFQLPIFLCKVNKSLRCVYHVYSFYIHKLFLTKRQRASM